MSAPLSPSVTPALAALLELNATSTAESELLRAQLVAAVADREDDVRQRTRLEQRCAELQDRLQLAHTSCEAAKAKLAEQEWHREQFQRDLAQRERAFEDEVSSLRAAYSDEVDVVARVQLSNAALMESLEDSHKQHALARMAQLRAEQLAETLRSRIAIQDAEVRTPPPPSTPSSTGEGSPLLRPRDPRRAPPAARVQLDMLGGDGVSAANATGARREGNERPAPRMHISRHGSVTIGGAVDEDLATAARATTPPLVSEMKQRIASHMSPPRGGGGGGGGGGGAERRAFV
jgi:hypothetical protein